MAIQNTYDEKGRVIAVSQGERGMQFSYDNLGNLSYSKDIYGNITRFKYDSGGRVIEKILPNMAVIKFGYDKNGNVTSITPPQRNAHKFGLNPFELVGLYLPPELGGKETATKYTYNLDKQLTKIERPDGKIIDFNFDQKSGELNSIVSPSGEYVYSYYEESGQPSKIISPDLVETTLQYKGPLFEKEMISFEKVNSTYSLDFNFDFSLKSTSVSDGINRSEIAIEYDKDSLPVKIGAESFFYDTNGVMKTIKQGSFDQSLSHNEYGELLEDVVQVIQEKKKHKENKHKDNKPEKPVYKMSLRRDHLGRIIHKSESINEDHGDSFDYLFDTGNRLVEVFKGNRSIRKYVYDANGNRIKKFEEGKKIEASYDEQDRLFRYGKNHYKYNSNGDLEEKISHEGKKLKLEYDVFGNLKKVHLGKKDVIEYLVDGRNRRVGKKINGKLVQAFIYQSQTQIAAELDGNGNIIKRFVYGSKPNIPDYFIANGKEYRIVSDQVGTPKLIIDLESGKVVQKYEFDEFGNLRDNDDYNEHREGKMLLPFGFAGGLYDPETNLVRFGARDYDPEVGRWTSKDPILFGGGDTNIYGYTFSDPINFIDPTGLICQYSQGTGHMTCTSSSGQTYYNQIGYSGSNAGNGRNNPAVQGVPNVGPIPQGTYTAGSPVNSPNTGPNTIMLTPNASTALNITNMGRDPNSFRIHGNNSRNDASHGCIILPPNRTTIPLGENFLAKMSLSFRFRKLSRISGTVNHEGEFM